MTGIPHSRSWHADANEKKKVFERITLVAAAPSQPPRAARVCQAPLAAGVLHDAGAGVPFVAAPSIAAAGGRRCVGFTAAGEAPPQVLEQVSGEEHVDPGVTAAVEAGQQHGDDEGHVCGQRHEVRSVYSVVSLM